MYQNLSDALNKKGISFNAAAALLDMPESTFRSKILSRSFSVEEAFDIKRNLFPEMDLAFLFERTSESA